MPLISQIVCDNCQAVKKETNHWYTLGPDLHGVFVRPLEHANRDSSCSGQSLQYFCGRFCLLEALRKWMDGMSEQFVEVGGNKASR